MFTIQIINNFRISNSEKPKPIEHWYLQHRYTGKSKPLKHGENNIGNTPTIRGFLDDIVLKTKYISPKQCKIYTHKDNTDYVINHLRLCKQQKFDFKITNISTNNLDI